MGIHGFPKTSSGRWYLWLGVTLLLIAVVGAVSLKIATGKLKDRIEAALGPNSEVQGISVGLSSVEITGIRIKADKDWPAPDELSAKRVVVRPDWGTLMSAQIGVGSIEVDTAYVSMLRRRDGKLALLPSLLARTGEAHGKESGGDGRPMPEIRIDGVTLSDAAVDFFDASVRQPAHKLRLEKTSIRLGRILLPALTGNTRVTIDGAVKGVQHDGKIAIDGVAEIASKNSDMSVKLSGVDLIAFQPYLIKATETGVRKGSLDLDLKSTVKDNRLHAPGTVTLAGLELNSGKTFMGMPRDTVLAMLKDKDGRISVRFELDGRLDDPKFSLNESLSTRVGTSLAGSLGISLEGLATGIGSAGSSAAQAVGGAVNKLFGSKRQGTAEGAR